MANKRILKKQIKYAFGELALQTYMTLEFIEKADKAKLEKLLGEINDRDAKAVKNVTFSFDKTPRDFENRQAYNKAKRAYYKQAFKTFTAKLSEEYQQMVKELNSAIPSDQKEVNKAIAQG